jgi:hypothetical protein
MGCEQTEAVLKAMDYLDLPNMQVIVTLWVDHISANWKKQAQMFWNLMDNNLAMATDSASSMSVGDPGYFRFMHPVQHTAQDSHSPTVVTTASLTVSKTISKTIGVSVRKGVFLRNEDHANVKAKVPMNVLNDYTNEIRQGLAQRASQAAMSQTPSVVALGQHLKQIPIFSSDLGRSVDQIVNQVDWVMSNIHPFFAYTVVEQAATWAFSNFKNETMKTAGGKPAAIPEVGWPSGPASTNLGKEFSCDSTSAILHLMHFLWSLPSC